MVRRGAVGTGAHDREVSDVVALGDESLEDLVAHVGLGPTDQWAVRDPIQHPVGGPCGQTQQLDLLRILHDPEMAEDARRALEAGARQRRLQPKQMDRPEAVGDAKPNGVLRRGPAREQAGHHLYRVIRLVPCGHLEQACPRRRAVVGRTGLKAGHNQGCGADRRKDEHGEPLGQDRVVAGQVQEVRADPDEERAQAPPIQALASPQQSLSEPARRDRGPGRESPQGRCPLASAARSSHARRVAGPSSNSLR